MCTSSFTLHLKESAVFNYIALKREHLCPGSDISLEGVPFCVFPTLPLVAKMTVLMNKTLRLTLKGLVKGKQQEAY